MNDLKKLHTDYINAKATYKKGIENVHQKSKVINDTKLEINRARSRIVEIERALDNTRKGIGMSVSADEFTTLKNELRDKDNKLQDLKDILPIHERELSDLNNERMYNGRAESDILKKITTVFADEAANDVSISADSKLKEFTFAVLAQYGFHFSGRPDDYDALYRKIGEMLCKKLFTSDTGSVVLPTTEEAMANRDLFIKNLA